MWTLMVGPDEDGMYYQIKALTTAVNKLRDQLPSPKKDQAASDKRRAFALDLIKILAGSLGGGGVVGLIGLFTAHGA
jgi:hypothetical protein